jgi:hypothetical protein
VAQSSASYPIARVLNPATYRRHRAINSLHLSDLAATVLFHTVSAAMQALSSRRAALVSSGVKNNFRAPSMARAPTRSSHIARVVEIEGEEAWNEHVLKVCAEFDWHRLL